MKPPPSSELESFFPEAITGLNDVKLAVLVSTINLDPGPDPAESPLTCKPPAIRTVP